MANEVEIRVTSKEDVDLSSTTNELKDLRTQAGKADRASRDLAGGFDNVGERADGAETRMTGLASGIDGVTSLMDNPSPQEFAQGLADIADGAANFLIPTLKKVTTELITQTAQYIKNAATSVASAAKVVASWVLMGVQAMINGAKMAAAWLIGLGPIGLVIAAVAAIIAILVALGVGFDDIKKVAELVWNFILGIIKGVFNWLRENWPLVLAILTGPFGLAVLAIVRNWNTIKEKAGAVLGWIKDKVLGAKDYIIDKFGDVADFFTGLPGDIADAFSGLGDSIIGGIKSLWNSTVGGFGFSVPSWVPGVGGKEFRIPELARGGIAGGLARINERGNEMINLPSGSTVVPAPSTKAAMEQMMRGKGGVTVNLYAQGSILTERDIVGLITEAARNGAFDGVLVRT